MRGAVYPCPTCGYLTFAEPPGSYDICDVCGWEDDALQLEFATTLAGGANALTLADAQAAFATRVEHRRATNGSTTGVRRSGFARQRSNVRCTCRADHVRFRPLAGSRYV